MFDGIVKAFNNIGDWGKIFLRSGTTRTLTIIAIVLIGTAWILALKMIIIDTLKEAYIDKVIKYVICITTIVVLIAVTVLVIIGLNMICSAITEALR